MNIRQQIQALIENDQLNDWQKFESLWALIPAEVQPIPFDKISSLRPEELPAFKEAVEVAEAALQILQKTVADKLQEN
jgi:hypothetical protein